MTRFRDGFTGMRAGVEDDFLEPGDANDPDDEDRRDDVADEEAKQALEPDRDEAAGIEGPEHFGLTPPG